MSKRKILALALTVAMIAILAVGGSLAYFTAEDEATNTFTVGNVAIDLTEPNWEGTGSKDAPEVYPGEALAKDPTVTNTGANPCFVRVKVEGLDCLGDAGTIVYRDANYAVNTLNAGWEEYDGYFYYTSVLAAGETTTTPCFSSIKIPTGLENGDGETEFDIDVTAYAVQAQGAKPSFSDVQNMSVAEIAAWFATCGL